MSDLLDFSPPGQTTFPLSGAKARFYDAGTTTLRTVFADQAETVPHPDPLLADASGRFPQAFVSGGPVKVVVTQADDSTGYTLDPCEKVAAAGAGASQISFAPTIALPQTNVQAAIEAAAASAASGFTPFGLGVTGSVDLLANLDATNIASGQYRFDATTTGTFPTGVAAADTGAVEMIRETSGSAWMRLYHDTTDRLFTRRMNASTWGAWREEITSNIGAAEGDIIYRTSTAWTRLAKGTARQVLRMNAGATAPEWATAAINLGTPSASTSGTSVDFINIPSTARRVTILLAGVSTSGTSGKIIQIGDSGGIETTGYLGAESNIAGAVGTANVTVGFGIRSVIAADVLHGVVTLSLIDSSTNTWVASGVLSASNQNSSFLVSGSKSLSAALDRIRLTTQGGTDTFDAGTVNVSWE